MTVESRNTRRQRYHDTHCFLGICRRICLFSGGGCRDTNVSQCEMNSLKLSKRYISIKNKARVEPKAKTNYRRDSRMKVYYITLHIKILKENSEASSKNQGQHSTSTPPDCDLLVIPLHQALYYNKICLHLHHITYLS